MNTETLALLDKYFDLAINAPDGIKRLRETILTLAMQGKLVPQDPNDPPASELLKEIETEKKRLVQEGKIKEPKPLSSIKPEEVPYLLPESWEWMRLGDIGETNIGLTYSPSNISNTGTPVLRSSNIQNGKLDFQDLVRVDMEIKNSVMVQDGDLLICARNGSKALVGKTALICNLDEPMAFGAFMAIFRSSLNLFILKFINSPLFRRMISAVNTMTINQITQDNLRNTIFPLPPLPEQRRIVAKIDELMARVDELERKRDARNERRIAMHQAAVARLLDAGDAGASRGGRDFIFAHFTDLYGTKENVAELRKAILQLAVMGRLVPQDPQDPPASEILKEIEAEKKRLVQEGTIKEPKPLPPIKPEEVPYQLPESWEWVRLGGIAQYIQRGKGPVYSEEKTYPVISQKCIQWAGFDSTVIKFVDPKRILDYADERFIQKNDLLWNSTGTGTIGRIGIYQGELCNYEKVVADSHVTVIRLTRIEPRYVLTFLQSPLIQNSIDQMASGTTNQIELNTTTVIEQQISLPPLHEQHRIVAKVDELMALCDQLEKRIDERTAKESALLEAVAARV